MQNSTKTTMGRLNSILDIGDIAGAQYRPKAQDHPIATPIGAHATIRPRTIAKELGLIASVLILINIVAGIAHVLGGYRYYELARMFVLDGENNIPTFYSSLLLLAAGLVLASIAGNHTREARRYAVHWRALSVIFVVLAVDEMVSLHEMFNFPIRQLLGIGGVGFFGFVVVAIPLVVILAIVYARFLIQLPSQIRLIFVLAALLYLGGQIGVEMLGGAYFERNGSATVGYLLITTLEESLELSGIILFIYGLLLYAARNLRKIRFSLEEAG